LNTQPEEAFQVKKRIRQKIAEDKRRLERRLEKAVRPGGVNPTLRGQNIRYEMGEKSRAIPWGGIGAGVVKNLVEIVLRPPVHFPGWAQFRDDLFWLEEEVIPALYLGEYEVLEMSLSLSGLCCSYSVGT
jgi:hypothetical protein